MKKKGAGIQYAALPYRLVGRRLEILLITSRESRRWVIPKGWPMKGLKPSDAAAVEALEEAGLIGEVEERPIGSYRYLKALKNGHSIAVQVLLFPMRIEGQEESWKEQSQREAQWFRYQDAAGQVAESSLRRLIREFGRTRTPGLLTEALRHGPMRWGLSLMRPAQRPHIS